MPKPDDLLTDVIDYYNEIECIKRRSADTVDRIIKRYSSTEKFIASLEPKLIDSPKSRDFHKLYKLYDTIFELPEEKTDEKGFLSILALNDSKDFKKALGKFQEAWIYLEDPSTKEVIAGVNFDVFASGKENGIDGTVAVIYTFVKPDYRYFGLGKKLLECMENYASNFLSGKTGKDAVISNARFMKNILCFGEVNDPAKLDLLKYYDDLASAKIDPCDRAVWWMKRGYRKLDFEYVQPPLSSSQKKCNYTSIYVKSNKKSIPSSVALEHMKKFFSFTIFSSPDISKNPFFLDTKKKLSKSKIINLTKPNYSSYRGKFLARLKKSLKSDSIRF
ncbi:MAG: GNAT family N-acetyltransferase [archaeon]